MKRNSAVQELNQLLFSVKDSLPLGVFRILFATLLLVRAITFLLQPDTLFFAGSPMSAETSKLFWESSAQESVPYIRWQLWSISDSHLLPTIVLSSYIVSIVALLIGWHTRLASIFVYLLTVTLHRREPLIWTGGDQLLQFYSFWIIFLPVGAALSLDALSAKRPSTHVVRSWHYFLLQAQLALVYFSTFLLKIGTDSWKQGSALTQAWQLPFYARPWSAHLAAVPFLAEFGTWLTLVFELAFPLLIWKRTFRTPLLVIGVIFHLGVELTLRAGPFTYAMVLGYVSFLNGEWIRGLFRHLAKFRGRNGGLCWQVGTLADGKWEVYYDGNCSFCRGWIARARNICFPQIRWLNFREHSKVVAHLNPRFDQAAYLVIDRRVALPGFLGFRKLLVAIPRLWPLLMLVYLPGSRTIGQAIYRFVGTRYGPIKSALPGI